MSELSRSQIPPGGWQFYQPQTKWSAPTPVSSTFDQTVILIIKHRMANPAISIKNKLETDPASVGNELESYTRARLGMGPAISPKLTPPSARPQMSGAVSQAVAAVKKVAQGAAVLMEWDESGLPPVPKELAEKRAAICAGGCPKNDLGKSVTEVFTLPLANLIKRRFERLQQLNLTTSYDDKLAVCQACLCPLKLKVHTPIELIQKRLSPEARAELDPRCWILAGT